MIMTILAIRAFFQVRKYLRGAESGAFMAKYIFDWFFVLLYCFAIMRSINFPSFHIFEFHPIADIPNEDMKSDSFAGLLYSFFCFAMWVCLASHFLILTSILIKNNKLNTFGDTDLNRFIKFVSKEINDKNWPKAFNMFKSKWRLVQDNAVLLSYLGDNYVGMKNFDQAVGAYVESLEFGNDNALKVDVTLKAADICVQELKDVNSAVELIDDSLRQSLEESEYILLENKKAEILAVQ